MAMVGQRKVTSLAGAAGKKRPVGFTVAAVGILLLVLGALLYFMWYTFSTLPANS